jgi:hypothetical protein
LIETTPIATALIATALIAATRTGPDHDREWTANAARADRSALGTTGNERHPSAAPVHGATEKTTINPRVSAPRAEARATSFAGRRHAKAHAADPAIMDLRGDDPASSVRRVADPARLDRHRDDPRASSAGQVRQVRDLGVFREPPSGANALRRTLRASWAS